MKKLLSLLLWLLMLSVVALLGLFVWHKKRNSPQPKPTAALPTLPKPAREFRFATLGRPSELPLHALARMPELQGLPLKFISCQQSAQRWLLLAAGQVDVVLASSDELALALPRLGPDLKVFPIARQSGNEQVVMSKDSTSPWVGYLPGGVSQGLALDLKDPQLQFVSLQSPEQALQMVRSGQLRGAALWNPWLEKAKSEGLSAPNPASRGFEVWCWCQQGEISGRLSPEDGLKVARAWLELVAQLQSQPELTQRAIAEEAEISAVQVPATLQGLEFLNSSLLHEQRANLTDELRTCLKQKVNLWSLAGEQVGGDINKLQVDFGWLEGLEASPPSTVETPTAPLSPTPETSESPVGNVPTGVPGDPFDRPDLVNQQSQAGGDAARTGRLPGPAVVHEPKQVWQADLPQEPTTAVIGSPDGEQLFVGCSDGQLVSLDSSDGRVQWTHALGERIRSAPVCDESAVAAAADNGLVIAIDRATGARRWQAQASTDVVGALGLADGALYAACLDGSVKSWDWASGTERWSVPAAGNITGAPAIAGKSLITVGVDRLVKAHDLESGKVQWQFRAGGECRGTPSIESGLVVFGCADHYVYALKVRDGSLAWKSKLPEEVACAPCMLGRNVYVGCKDNVVYALDRGQGKQVWKYPTRERIVNDLVGCSDTVYAVSQDMRVYALGASDGKLSFRYKASGWLQTPWLAGGVLYVPVADHTVRALR